VLSGRVTLLMSSSLQIAASVEDADLVIGAVLVPGALAPKLVTREMIAGMKEGAVVVDVAIDQGGCFETSHRPRTPTRLRCRRRYPLLRREHAGRGAHHVDEGADERDPAVRRGDREQGTRGRSRSRSGAREGRERDRGQGDLRAVAEAHSLDYTPLAGVLPLTAV